MYNRFFNLRLYPVLVIRFFSAYLLKGKCSACFIQLSVAIKTITGVSHDLAGF
jgi:hypothetical protein